VVESSEVGSLPIVGDYPKFLGGASNYGLAVSGATTLFERRIVDSLLDKLQAGIDVPCYPQFRDMNQMFLDMIEGIAKINGSCIETGSLTLRDGKSVIPEVVAIKSNSQEIGQKLNHPFQLRICVTGPYTLSSTFAFKDKNTFTRLGAVLTKIAEDNIFNNKYGSVRLVAIDEPIFGFIDDPLLDRGSEARENLLKAWESIMQKARSKGARTCLHLHKTIDELFWDVKSLNALELPVDDPLYQAKRTKERLESTDKFLNASISVTDFDQLIRAKILATANPRPSETTINEKIADTWNNLRRRAIDPLVFLEDVELMRSRLNKIVGTFGCNRVLYAGPECALRSFPTYESAIECLRRVSQATKTQS